MGVVVRWYIDILIKLLIPTPLVLALFCSSIPTSSFIYKMPFRSCNLFFWAFIFNYEHCVKDQHDTVIPVNTTTV